MSAFPLSEDANIATGQLITVDGASRCDRDREHGGCRSTGLGYLVAAATQRVGGGRHRFEADDVVGLGSEDLRGRVALLEAHLDTTGAT
jgi:hypothetical protein